jgi:hypothetical protein
MKTPSVVVATGSSFGWLSVNQPSRSRLMFAARATCAESSRGSIATMSTTRSAGSSTSSPESSSRKRTSMPEGSPGGAASTFGGACLSNIMNSVRASALRW